MIDISTFEDYYRNGLLALPIVWNTEARIADKHPIHDINAVDINIEYVKRLLSNGFANANGIAIKVMPPIGMIDFDLKNTLRKDIFSEWIRIIRNTMPDILRKVCIETTRSGGYHVFINHHKLREKITLARSEDHKEVIAIYTGGLLSYSYPTPGYELYHNEFCDVQPLADDEFDMVVSTAAIFNEEKEAEHVGGAIITYPPEYEGMCLQFDNKISDDAYERLLNDISLNRVTRQNVMFARAKYIPYLRTGSNANYSAKVYWNSRKLLIFSASMAGYPTWHDSTHYGDTRWVLTPARIIYYKCGRKWQEALDLMRSIMDSIGVEYTEVQQLGTAQLFTQHSDGTVDTRLQFPYDVLPIPIQEYIGRQVLQHEFIAASMLAAFSAIIGNSAAVEAMRGYLVKPILYIGLVGPPGSAKTPAMRKAFEPLEGMDNRWYGEYKAALKDYRRQIAKNGNKGKNNDSEEDDNTKPDLQQILIKDATIEMVVKVLSVNKNGCCMYADELSGFMARMNQYKDGDEVQKWLELWSGNPILLQRITREENKVEKPFCTVIGGIQPKLLEEMSSNQNANNGFYHRFLFCYPEPQQKPEWQQILIPEDLVAYYEQLFLYMHHQAMQGFTKYSLSRQANDIYKQWHDAKNSKYNKTLNEDYKGIIAKYQDYCLRFSVLLQCLYEAGEGIRSGYIDGANMERAIRLTEYFFANMHKAIKVLKPESPIDRMEPQWQRWYSNLPEFFTQRQAIEIARQLDMKEGSVKSYIHRNKNILFKNAVEPNTYEKLY